MVLMKLTPPRFNINKVKSMLNIDKITKTNLYFIIIIIIIFLSAIFVLKPKDESNIFQKFVNYWKKPNKFSVVKGCQIPLKFKEILETKFTADRYIQVDNVFKRQKYLPWTIQPAQKTVVHNIIRPYLDDLTKSTGHNFRIVGYNNVIVTADNSNNAQYRIDVFVHDFTGGWGNTEYRFMFDIIIYNNGVKYLNFVKILNSQDMKSNMEDQEKVSYTSIQEGDVNNPDPENLEFSFLDNQYESSLSEKSCERNPWGIYKDENDLTKKFGGAWPCKTMHFRWNQFGVLDVDTPNNKYCSGNNSATEKRNWSNYSNPALATVPRESDDRNNMFALTHGSPQSPRGGGVGCRGGSSGIIGGS